jgi:hypothetical protein
MPWHRELHLMFPLEPLIISISIIDKVAFPLHYLLNLFPDTMFAETQLFKLDDQFGKCDARLAAGLVRAEHSLTYVLLGGQRISSRVCCCSSHMVGND